MTVFTKLITITFKTGDITHIEYYSLGGANESGLNTDYIVSNIQKKNPDATDITVKSNELQHTFSWSGTIDH